MFVALVAAIGWVTSEVVRRSDPRRLEQLAAVIDHVSTGSAQHTELQKEVDRLALRIAVRRRRPNCSLLWFFGLVSGLGTIYVLIRMVLGLILGILNPGYAAPDLAWQFWAGYVVTLVTIFTRMTVRSSWFDSEYQRISCEPKPTFSWRWLFTA
ncbi:hypothetical protein C3B59_17140 [Cryobacterium zongtaii]|uniref:Uncharacterized protein n=1 Tax=Cryobacterium zongtaii TaxID=1259217 RepID=A0A2S3Z5Y0_9MICO|nr:hypothetical protein C3B59_17140 [Cryobacterium zongtaii]